MLFSLLGESVLCSPGCTISQQPVHQWIYDITQFQTSDVPPHCQTLLAQEQVRICGFSVTNDGKMVENKRLLLEYIWGIRRKTNCWLIVTVVIFNSDDEKVWSQRNRKYVNVIYLNHLNRSWFLLFVAVALFCLTMRFRIWTHSPEYGSNRSYFWLTCPCFPAGITVNLTWGRPSPLRTAAQDFWTTRASFPASRPRGSTESAAVRRRDSPPASPEPGYPPPPPSHAGTPWARGE